MRFLRVVPALDYHTEGEPMRIVNGGVPTLAGRTMLERSARFAADHDGLRRMILFEPRGHAAMCAALLVPPSDPAADTGVVFVEPLGVVHMCGHGAIAIATMLVETGATAMREPETPVVLDTAAGRVTARVRVDGGRVSGGGARSELWLRIVASVLGLPLERTAVEEGAAYGAALLGGVAGGVFGDVPEGAEVLRKEVFGPVLTLQTFEDEEEAIALANETDYGLAAIVYTGDRERAERVSERVVAGTVWVNSFFVRDLRAPFGGAKSSGVGREGGVYSFDFYADVKNVCSAPWED